MAHNNGISKVAVKLHTHELSAMRQVVLHVLGGTEVYAEPGLCIVKFSNGSILELYGPGSNFPSYLFNKNNMVLSYTVNDLDTVTRDAIYSGMKVVASGRSNGACYPFLHLSDPEGNLIEVLEKQD